MIIEQPPLLYRRLFPGTIWRIPSLPHEPHPSIYLTFDDGPIPEVTPWVLDTLASFGVKATFFCVGENVWRFYPLFQQILAEGHSVGNHTYHHLQALPTPTRPYLLDVTRADHLIHSPLFRPPHGHLGWSQLAELRKHYQLIMWDVVTRDYSRRLTPPQVLQNVVRYSRNGSIIVFHDSLKSEVNLRYALPRAIKYLLSEGYQFKLLPGRQLLTTPVSLLSKAL